MTLLASALFACGPTVGSRSGQGRCELADPPPFDEILEGRDGWRRWTPPARPPVHLAELPLEAAGATPTPSPPLAAWTGEALAGWTPVAGRPGRLRSPAVPAAAERAERLRLRLRTGGAERLEIVLFSSSSVDATDRVSRGAELPLPRAAPDEPVTVELDIHELVGGNWADAWKEARLEGLELAAGEGAAGALSIEEIALYGPAARYEAAPAGAGTLELAGALRPGLYVHTGAEARVALTLPEGEPTLRWAWGSAEPGTRGALRLLHDGRETTLKTEDLQADWRVGSASLAPWAGQRVSLAWSAEGGGVLLVGDPRLTRGEPSPRTPDVLVYLMDALRADALHAWGNPDPEASPTLDRLAADGVQLMRASSVSSWTKPVVPSLLSGIWPTRHQVGAQRFTDRLPASVPLVQEGFRAAGWRTGSFSANPLASTLSGLERGFELALPPRRWRGQITPLGAPTAAQLHAGLLGWIAEEPDRPFFAYVHALEVHQAYLTPFSRPDPRAGYASAVRAADDALGELLEALAPRRAERPLLLALVSDHGESFGEHGLSAHGTGLQQSQLHVPVILWAGEDLPALRVQEPVSLADIAPTLRSLARLPPLPEADGLDLAPLLGGAEALDRPGVPAALLRFSWTPSAPRQYALITREGEKLIQREDGQEMAYDLDRDPCELDPRPPDPALRGALEAWRRAQEAGAADFARAHGVPAPATLDEETVRELRALGYVR